MTTVPVIEILVYFGTAAAAPDVWVLEDPVRGALDSVYGLASDAIDLADRAQTITIDRGKASLFDGEFNAGTCTVELLNHDRYFDPLYTAGALYGNIKPGKRVQVLADGLTIFDGRVSDWNYSYDRGGQSMAIMECEDALAVLARKRFTAWTATAAQTAGPRLAAVLNRTEVAWSGAARDLDTGISTLQGDSVTWGSSVLNYAQLVARSDMGAFFASRTGLLTFRDRHSTLLGTPVLAIDQGDGGGMPFQEVELKYGSEEFYTRVSIDREGGTAQTYTSSMAATDDIITLSIGGLLLDSDSQSLSMATYIATVFANGDAHVSSVSFALDSRVCTAAQIAAALAIDIYDLVTVSFTPNGIGDPIDQTLVVLGVRHEPMPEDHIVTLTLGIRDGRAPWILEDPIYGALDGPGVLTF